MAFLILKQQLKNKNIPKQCLECNKYNVKMYRYVLANYVVSVSNLSAKQHNKIKEISSSILEFNEGLKENLNLKKKLAVILVAI
jgi:hypothetical protein